MNAAVVTARGGSKSIPGKNLLPVGGVPLVVRQVRQALAAPLIARVYCSTDSDEIASAATQAGAVPIMRPAILSHDTANHGHAIDHAAQAIDADLGGRLETLVVLLGNTAMVTADDIQRCLLLLRDRPDLDSVMTVWEAGDDHPHRAFQGAEDGTLLPFGGPRDVPCNRQEYRAAYYYDNGVWALRKRCLAPQPPTVAPPTLSPWWWMGERMGYVVRPWVTGRDIHSPLDVAIAEWWLREGSQVANATEER